MSHSSHLTSSFLSSTSLFGPKTTINRGSQEQYLQLIRLETSSGWSRNNNNEVVLTVTAGPEVVVQTLNQLTALGKEAVLSAFQAQETD